MTDDEMRWDMMTDDEIEIRDTLEMALGRPDVWLIHASNGEGGRGPEDDTETESEKIVRYWVYWNEFNREIPKQHRRIILSYCLFKRLGYTSRQFGVSRGQARRIINNGLEDITGSISNLITNCQGS